MPIRSKAQRKFLWANMPAVAGRLEKQTPNGIKLPERVKHAYVHGVAEALAHYGLKTAAREIRLKIPTRKFHGVDAAFQGAATHGQKQADSFHGEPMGPQADPGAPVERLTALLQGLSPDTENGQGIPRKDPRDTAVRWGAPTNLDAGDAAGRISDMGQPTSTGTVV